VQLKKKRKPLPKKAKSKAPFSFPWWGKIIAYFLSYLFAGICIFFIIVKGISFGNDLTTKWLTSVLISLFTSVFLTQPIQASICVFI